MGGEGAVDLTRNFVFLNYFKFMTEREMIEKYRHLAWSNPNMNAEGYLSLLENPPTLSEIGFFFKEQRDILEDYLLNRSN